MLGRLKSPNMCDSWESSLYVDQLFQASLKTVKWCFRLPIKYVHDINFDESHLRMSAWHVCSSNFCTSVVAWSWSSAGLRQIPGPLGATLRLVQPPFILDCEFRCESWTWLTTIGLVTLIKGIRVNWGQIAAIFFGTRPWLIITNFICWFSPITVGTVFALLLISFSTSQMYQGTCSIKTLFYRTGNGQWMVPFTLISVVTAKARIYSKLSKLSTPLKITGCTITGFCFNLPHEAMRPRASPCPIFFPDRKSFIVLFLLLPLHRCQFLRKFSNRNLDVHGWVARGCDLRAISQGPGLLDLGFFGLKGSLTSWKLKQSQTLSRIVGEEFLLSLYSLICSQSWEPCKHRKQCKVEGFRSYET